MMAVTHIQNREPAPPIAMADATPMMFPVPTLDAVEIISAPKDEIPFSLFGLSLMTLNVSAKSLP